MPDMPPVTAYVPLMRWAVWLSLCRHRRLVWWPAMTRHNEHLLAPIVAAFAKPWIWVGSTPPYAALPEVLAVDMTLAHTQLGREAGVVIFDARSKVDADALGAVAGTIVGGGVLIVLTPHDGEGPSSSRFMHYLYRHLRQDKHVLRVSSTGRCEWQLPSEEERFETQHQSMLLDPVPEEKQAAEEGWRNAVRHAVTQDQVRALMVLRQAPVQGLTALMAPRGRGKSATLGLAIAAWLKEGPFETLYLTAPRAAATVALFDRVREQCPDGQHIGNRFVVGERSLCFIAPDALTQRLNAGTLAPKMLLIDEAAALPQSFLLRWLSSGMPIVMATTLHGYEGSSQGFSHFLQQHAGQYTPVALATPVRWASHDPLERLIARILCLNAVPALLPCTAEFEVTEENNVQFTWLSQTALLEDLHVFHQIFGLLVRAHYRTSPDDLKTLFDHPAMSLWVAYVTDAAQVRHIIAVAMAFDEGGLSKAQAQAVADGVRRPPGHLLPQTLALHVGDASIATQRWRRITRIAVHPQCQRQGVGAALLNHVYQESTRADIDGLGASFGGQYSTLAFWRRCGFSVVRIGLKNDTVTGERAIIVARGCRNPAIMGTLSRSFWSMLPTQLAFELNALPPNIVGELICDAAPFLPAQPHQQREAVRRFGCQRAPLASVRCLLQGALLRYAACVPTPERGVMAGVLLQGRNDDWVCEQLPFLNGKRAVDRWLRRRVAEWLSHPAC